MKYLVTVIMSLLLSINIDWCDLILLEEGCYKDYWYSKEELNLELYSSSTVNVRTRADAKSSKLGILKTGEPIQVTALTDNNWYEVLFNDKRGYIKCEYLTELQTNTPIKYEDNIYYIGTGKSEINGVVQYLEIIPDFIKQEFKNDNSKLIITDENLGLRFYNDADLKVLGVTSFYPSRNNCEIYISSDKRAHYSVVHEIGHYIDGKLQFPSSSDEFKEIWGSEKSFISIFHSTNIDNVTTQSEYFAESFYLYLMDSDNLKKYCPLTYSFIKIKLDEFKQKYVIEDIAEYINENIFK